MSLAELDAAGVETSATARDRIPLMRRRIAYLRERALAGARA